MNAPNIKSVSIKPPSGLSFKCVKSGKSCKGLSVVGAKVKDAKGKSTKILLKLKS